MDERTREVLELIAGELEKLRFLKEHEMGVRVEDDEGSLWVRALEER